MRALPISIVDVSDTRPRAKLLVETEAGAPARSFRVRSEGRKVDVRALRKLDPGLYHVRVEVIDIAGNVGASPEGDVLVDHPVSSRVVARFLGVGRRVALTFDDCNVGSAWNSILTTLQQFHAKATFFCTGAAVLQNTAAALRTVRLGQTIGDHSFGHPDLSTYSFGPARTQFLRDQAIWWRLAKRTPLPFFRPPYGAYDHTTLAAAGSAGFAWTVLWDVDTRDWTLPGSNTIAARVLGEMRSGSIVLMHTLPQTAAALPTILRGLRRRHYQPLPLDQLFLLHGAQPIPGGWAP